MWEIKATLFELVLMTVANLFILLVGFLMHLHFDARSKRASAEIIELRNKNLRMAARKMRDLQWEMDALVKENISLVDEVVRLEVALRSKS